MVAQRIHCGKKENKDKSTKEVLGSKKDEGI